MNDTIWIIDTKDFDGYPVAKMCQHNPQYIHQSNPPITFEQYDEKYGGNHKQVSYEEIHNDWLPPFLEARSRWKEVSTEKFFDMLGCLPPLRHDMIEEYETFFMAEFDRGDETSVFARHTLTNKCYRTIRSISIDKSELAKSLSIVNI
jgi:hypothetical protein